MTVSAGYPGLEPLLSPNNTVRGMNPQYTTVLKISTTVLALAFLPGSIIAKTTLKFYFSLNTITNYRNLS